MGHRLTVVFSLLVLVSIGLLSLLSCVAPSMPTPVGMISTTLNEDGISGRNFFQACWSLEEKTPEEAESLRELRESIRDQIESDVKTSVTIWEDEYDHRLILETTADFRDPAEIESILAIIYGRGYGRPDISIKVRGPQSTELKTTWFVDMIVNPSQVPCIKNFEWKVNMPARITNVRVTPNNANVEQSRLGSNTVKLTFEPQDMFVTAFITAEESRAGGTIIWPIISGLAGAIVFAILAYVGRQIFRRARARRRRLS